MKTLTLTYAMWTFENLAEIVRRTTGQVPEILRGDDSKADGYIILDAIAPEHAATIESMIAAELEAGICEILRDEEDPTAWQVWYSFKRAAAFKAKTTTHQVTEERQAKA